jgi:DNA-binding transcriptional LysR family regulator
MPDFLVRDALRDGKLLTVLDDHVDGRGQFRLLWPSNRRLAPKVRAFVDFLPDRLAAALSGS